MNPNIPPYGQQMPMQPPQRRHEIPYGQVHPHMRPHPGFSPYYHQQQMAPMMPQYAQHYQQNWYPYQQHIPAHHAARHQYFPHPMMPMPAHQMPQSHGPMMVSPPQQSHASSPRHVPAPQIYTQHQQPHPYQYHHQHQPSVSETPSTSLASHTQTPPSRPLSIASGTNAIKEATPPVTPATVGLETAQAISSDAPVSQEVFSPPLPWLSIPDQSFPPRARRSRRKIPRSMLGTAPVTFPLAEVVPDSAKEVGSSESTAPQQLKDNELISSTAAHTPTPLPSNEPSEYLSTQPTTPLSTAPSEHVKQHTTPTQSKPVRAAVPVVPVLPRVTQSPTSSRAHRDSIASTASKQDGTTAPVDSAEEAGEATQSEIESIAPAPAPVLPPSSWASLLRTKNAAVMSSSGSIPAQASNGLTVSRTETLGDVLNEINVDETSARVTFLQPRGLVNTGNMCYMNSVLQMLVFCTPFYEFLDRVARRAPHTFKSDTPLIDAMIMFMREYPTIDAATSVEQLRLRLKAEDYERYGDSFIPEYVYNVIKQLPRFRDMRRGHQQDAQEFLGFLLEELHEECAHAMRSGTSASSGRSTPVNHVANPAESADSDSGWMEVGHKQKAAVTRSSGIITTESPITGIFGGKLRSELKIAGNKLSVTLEPYQPLQLDIGSHQVNNIVDALKGLTRPESMQGDFQSVRGLKTSATKQVFIETLPPVLILHLKRFHYDATTQRVEKIWKKVGYPLELEMPKEVFPTSARNRYAAHGGLPKYRLVGVIYHHGKNASGGHYTVDIRRQDGREWVRIDDTFIRRVRSEDVAEGGSEEDPKILAAALEQHKQGTKLRSNRFDQIEDQEDEGEKVWSQVNGHSRSKSTLSAIVNGTATPSHESSGPQTPRERFSVKDNKVAYLLFYQRIAT